jgi:hypothetical protein
MKMFSRSVVLLLILFVSVLTEAKTTKYDLVQLNSHNGVIQYPGLDFFNAKSAILTVTKTPPSIEPQLTSLEMTFPNAAKLTATNFKRIDGRYRAIVNGAWVYKEVVVELDNVPLESNFPVAINVFVSERTAFINPLAENPGRPLFTAFGIMRDITPIRIVDSESTMISNKKVILSLRDRLGVRSQGAGVPEGFIVDALWYGRGTKTLYLAAPVPRQEFDNIDVVSLVVTGALESDLMVSVKFKDPQGFEMISPPMPLKLLLDEAYGVVAP